MENEQLEHKRKRILCTSEAEFMGLCSNLANEVVNPSRKWKSRNPATFHRCCWTFRKRGRKNHDHVDSVFCSEIFGLAKKGEDPLTVEQVKEMFLCWLKKENYSTESIEEFRLNDTFDRLCEVKKQNWKIFKLTLFHQFKSLSVGSSPLKLSKPLMTDKERIFDEFLKRKAEPGEETTKVPQKVVNSQLSNEDKPLVEEEIQPLESKQEPALQLIVTRASQGTKTEIIPEIKMSKVLSKKEANKRVVELELELRNNYVIIEDQKKQIDDLNKEISKHNGFKPQAIVEKKVSNQQKVIQKKGQKTKDNLLLLFKDYKSKLRTKRKVMEETDRRLI